MCMCVECQEMKPLVIFIILIFSQCLYINTKKVRRPPYIRCFSSYECGPKMCCTLMVGRYKIPVCMPLRKAGASCNDELRYHDSVTIHFPKISVNLTDVYEESCPCVPNFSCDAIYHTCQQTLTVL